MLGRSGAELYLSPEYFCNRDPTLVTQATVGAIFYKDSVEYDANETMDNEPDFSDFITCHRSGRRNAIHDLQGDSTNLNLQKLSGTMEEISIAEGENQEEAGATDKEPGMTPKSQDGSPPL